MRSHQTDNKDVFFKDNAGIILSLKKTKKQLIYPIKYK